MSSFGDGPGVGKRTATPVASTGRVRCRRDAGVGGCVPLGGVVAYGPTREAVVGSTMAGVRDGESRTGAYPFPELGDRHRATVWQWLGCTCRESQYVAVPGTPRHLTSISPAGS